MVDGSSSRGTEMNALFPLTLGGFGHMILPQEPMALRPEKREYELFPGLALRVTGDIILLRRPMAAPQ